eukprot:PhM_4_TR16152/c0_g1_i2/m.43525
MANVSLKLVDERQWEFSVRNLDLLRSKFVKRIADYPGFELVVDINGSKLFMELSPSNPDPGAPPVLDFPLDYSVVFFSREDGGGGNNIQAAMASSAIMAAPQQQVQQQSSPSKKSKISKKSKVVAVVTSAVMASSPTPPATPIPATSGGALASRHVLYDFCIPGDAGAQSFEVSLRDVCFTRCTRKGEERSICAAVRFMPVTTSKFPQWLMDERGAVRVSFVGATNIRGCAISGRARVKSHTFRVGLFGYSVEYSVLKLMQKRVAVEKGEASRFRPHIQIQNDGGEVLYRINALSSVEWHLPQDYLEEHCPSRCVTVYVDSAIPTLPLVGTLYRRKAVIPKFRSVVGMVCTECVDLPDGPTITPQGSEGFCLEVGQRDFPFGNVAIVGHLRGLTLLNAVISFRHSSAAESAAIHTHIAPLVIEKFLQLDDNGRRIIDYGPYIDLRVQGVQMASNVPWSTVELSPKIPVEVEYLMRGVQQHEIYLFVEYSRLPALEPLSMGLNHTVTPDQPGGSPTLGATTASVATTTVSERVCTFQASLSWAQVAHTHGRMRVTHDAVWFDAVRGVDMLVEKSGEWVRRDIIVKTELHPECTVCVYDLGLIFHPTDDTRWKIPQTVRCALRIEDAAGDRLFDSVLNNPTSPNAFRFVLPSECLWLEASYPLRMTLCFGEVTRFSSRATRALSLTASPSHLLSYEEEDEDQDDYIWSEEGALDDTLNPDRLLAMDDDELSRKLKEFMERANLSESQLPNVSEKVLQDIEHACSVQSSGISKKSTTETAVLASADSMMHTAQKLMEFYTSKEGDLLDELCSNFGVALPTLMVSMTATHAAFSRKYPNIPASVLYVMVMYTCEGVDIDRKLGYPNVPPALRASSADSALFNKGVKERLESYKARTDAVYRVINAALRGGVPPPGTDPEKFTPEQRTNLATLKKWCKFILHLVVAATPLPGRVKERPLFRGLGRVTEPHLSAFRALKHDDFVCWPSASSCSQDEKASREFCSGPDSFMFKVMEPIEGIPLAACSQYPEEEEVLLPPFSLFSVVDTTDGGREFEMHSIGSFVTRGPITGVNNAEKKKFRSFLVSVRRDAEAEDARLRHLNNVLQMLVETSLRADVSIRTIPAHKERAVMSIAASGEHLITLGVAIYEDTDWELKVWKVLPEGKHTCVRTIVPSSGDKELSRHAFWCVHASPSGMGIGRDDGHVLYWPEHQRRPPAAVASNLPEYRLLRPLRISATSTTPDPGQHFTTTDNSSETVADPDCRASPHHGGRDVSALACSQKYIVSGDMSGCVRVWETLGWKQVAGVQFPSRESVRCVLLEQSHLQLFCGSEDKYIYVISTVSWSVTHVLGGHSMPVTCLSPYRCPDGSVSLISAGNDREIRIWAPSTDSGYTSSAPLKGHTANVKALMVVNGFLVSVSRDKTVKFWELDFDCANVKTLKGHEDHILCATPYIGYIATGCRDGTVKLWSPLLREDHARGFDISLMREILHYHFDDAFIVKVHELLSKYDENTDGLLTRAEMTDLYESLYALTGVPHPGAQRLQSEVLDDFRFWDKDRDNKLDLQELCAMLLQSKLATRIALALKK